MLKIKNVNIKENLISCQYQIHNYSELGSLQFDIVNKHFSIEHTKYDEYYLKLVLAVLLYIDKLAKEKVITQCKEIIIPENYINTICFS